MAAEPTREELAALAGYTVAYFNVTPEMRKLFDKALKELWEPQRLQSAIRNTQWYKSSSQTQREAHLLRSSDPSEYQRRLAQMRSLVGSMAVEIGIPLSGGDGNKLAIMALLGGWDETQIRRRMAQFGDVSQTVLGGRQNRNFGGTLGQTQARLRKAMADYGVRVSDASMSNWMSKIAGGQLTEQFAIGEIQRLAKATFPGLAEQIDNGLTVMDVASPYIESMAELLEINTQDVTLKDPHLRKALSQKDDKGQWTTQSVADFEIGLRKDSRWMKTNNARESMMGTGHQVLQLMGLVS